MHRTDRIFPDDIGLLRDTSTDPRVSIALLRRPKSKAAGARRRGRSAR